MTSFSLLSYPSILGHFLHDIEGNQWFDKYFLALSIQVSLSGFLAQFVRLLLVYLGLELELLFLYGGRSILFLHFLLLLNALGFFSKEFVYRLVGISAPGKTPLLCHSE